MYDRLQTKQVQRERTDPNVSQKTQIQKPHQKAHIHFWTTEITLV